MDEFFIKEIVPEFFSGFGLLLKTGDDFYWRVEGTQILKTDKNFNIIWSKEFSKFLSSKMMLSTSTQGEFLILASLRDSPADSTGVMGIIRISSSGNIIWQKEYDINTTTSYNFLKVLSADEYLVTIGEQLLVIDNNGIVLRRVSLYLINEEFHAEEIEVSGNRIYVIGDTSSNAERPLSVVVLDYQLNIITSFHYQIGVQIDEIWYKPFAKMIGNVLLITRQTKSEKVALALNTSNNLSIVEAFTFSKEIPQQTIVYNSSQVIYHDGIYYFRTPSSGDTVIHAFDSSFSLL
ncbi:MAG: hypothetical protein AAGF77_07000 [Bacteroidota bacterium]